MASHQGKKSCRMPVELPDSGLPFSDKQGKVYRRMRPGKTKEDRRTGSWVSKEERNARHAARREALDRRIK